MLLVGLGNRCRQGKDFVAMYMQQAYPPLVRYAFADELKKHCKANHERLVDEFYRENQLHPTRHPLVAKEDPIYGYTAILQYTGMKMRKIEPDYWINLVKERITKEQPDAVVIPDVRFPNEAEFIKNNGGYMVQVLRIGPDGQQMIDPNRDPNHPSETSLDDYDYDFYIRGKNGDLNALEFKAKGTLGNIIRDHAERLTASSVPDSTGHSSDNPAVPFADEYEAYAKYLKQKYTSGSFEVAEEIDI